MRDQFFLQERNEKQRMWHHYTRLCSYTRKINSMNLLQRWRNRSYPSYCDKLLDVHLVANGLDVMVRCLGYSIRRFITLSPLGFVKDSECSYGFTRYETPSASCWDLLRERFKYKRLLIA
ncbi:hypothetical protein CEXT_213701 [Caerostris extrusa]|uniref:Uncharacterized protein n=1 Tax=Caerostris extrusa TaxID=172846 RepID=A0AAV4XBF3_CAEEX|nr:hypothetical protein CEXT_213701 [Caerostris extrusa]